MKKIIKQFAFVASLLFVYGCFNLASPPVKEVTEAHEKFIEISKKDLGIEPVLVPLKNTVWIYLPSEKGIIDIKASGAVIPSSNKATISLSLQYVDAYFKDNNFYIEYDISETKKYDKNFGYISSYSTEYQKNQRTILYNIHRAYADLETVPGDVQFKDETKDRKHKKLVSSYIKTGMIPDFFVFVIADVIKGLEASTTIYFDDIKKILSPISALPLSESTNRYIMDIKGNKAAIGDTTGKHLDYKEITMPDFLAKQMINRINFKYTRSSFSPGEDTIPELLKIAARTLQLYDYTNFNKLIIKNIGEEEAEESIFTKEAMQKFINEKIFDEPEKKYHIIQFNGKEKISYPSADE